MATSAVGNPYVESSDLVANYPATSLSLATRLDKYALNPFADATARDAAIPSPVQGQLAQTLDDNNAWKYDGTAWAPFSGAAVAANFTDTATGTYTDAEGVDYKYITYNSSGSLTIDVAGECEVLVVGGGGGGKVAAFNGKGGYSVTGTHQINVATHTITIGAGGPGGSTVTGSGGGDSSLGTLFKGFGAGVGDSSLTNFDSSITGSAVTYATAQTSLLANSGNGGNSSGSIAGSSGIVVVAVRT